MAALTYSGDCSNSEKSGTLVSGPLVRASFNWCLCTYSWVSAPHCRCLRVDSLLVPRFPNFGCQSISFLVKRTFMCQLLASTAKPPTQGHLLCVTNSYALLKCQIINCPSESSYNNSVQFMTQWPPFHILKTLLAPH